MKSSPFQSRIVQLIPPKLLRTDVDDTHFIHYAEAWARSTPSAVLLSGGFPPVEGRDRYSIACRDPMAVFSSKGTSCTICDHRDKHSLTGDPLEIMDEFAAGFRPVFPLAVPPFSGGAVGYFAYDLKNTIEHLPQTACDDLNLPDILLFWPRQVLVHDRTLKQLHLLEFDYEGDTDSRLPACPDSEPFNETDGVRSLRVGNLRSNFTHEEYLDAVGKVRHYIREGDVYQVNLSQRYSFSLDGNPFQLWKSLYDINPASFYAFINAGDHQVLSTSMERFLLRRGRTIETRPIKGTRKRGETPDEDDALRRELLEDAKDDAELSMIVDLLRNDLGRVCEPRTIRVAEHKRLETYQNVHHLVSIVIGRLKKGVTAGELLRATFPGGSITGCPKIRAMEIIDELEPHVRHIYTGSIGYLGWHDNLDLNIAIRTALIVGENCTFSVGGGIVYDSTEEAEYQETLHKGRTLFQLIERTGKASP